MKDFDFIVHHLKFVTLAYVVSSYSGLEIKLGKVANIDSFVQLNSRTFFDFFFFFLIRNFKKHYLVISPSEVFKDLQLMATYFNLGCLVSGGYHA